MNPLFNRQEQLDNEMMRLTGYAEAVYHLASVKHDAPVKEALVQLQAFLAERTANVKELAAEMVTKAAS